MPSARAVTGLALAAALIVGATACKSFLDVNKNPNAPVTVRMSLTLPGIEVAFMNDLLASSNYYGDSYAMWGDEWTQQWSYNQNINRPYSQFNFYEMTSIDTDGMWTDAYANIGQECENMINTATAKKAYAYRGIARFILAWTGSILTDAFGPIPWSQAFDTKIVAPKYDNQKEVYASVLPLLDSAIADMKTSGGEVPSDNDLLFAGDMSKWLQLAQSVKASLNLHIIYASGQNTKQIAQTVLTAANAGLTADADFAFPGGTGAEQPMWQDFDTAYNGYTEHYVASTFMINLLDSLNDPRLPIMFTKALSDGQYRGEWDGSFGEPDSTLSKIGPAFTHDNRAFEWFTLADNDFDKAEAELILSGAAAADADYRAGIQANMQSWGVPVADISTYVSARPPLTSADALERIITQKYIANFMHIGPWTDWRRTGFPKLQYIPTDPKALIAYTFHNIPFRLRTPAGPISYNAENVLGTGIDEGMAGMEVKLWFAGGNLY